MGFFDKVDLVHKARADGREARCRGAVRGENPASCHSCRAQWFRGWDEGDVVMAQIPMVAVIR